MAPRWLLAGYVLGLMAMSPAPVLYYWLFAPAAPVIVAGLCVFAGMVHPGFRTMALGALTAAVFGGVSVLVFSIAVANQ